MESLFEIDNIRCSYDKNGLRKIVLEIDHLVIPRGKKVFIVGESGIGKSTVLEVLGMMNNTIVDSEETNFIFIGRDNRRYDLGQMWRRNNDEELSDFRLKHFNFIFQSTNLMANFSAYENIALTRMLQGYSMEESLCKAKDALRDLGIPDLDLNRKAQELSGGQQQRIAFARAIIPDFTVLFGDEPTGNLDSENAFRAMKLLSTKLNDIPDSSAIIVSHDMHLAIMFADVVIKVRRKNDRGFIDMSSMYLFDKENKQWSNGHDTYSSDDFEVFLRKRLA